ncbi:zinc finger BED domain-containing protein RICESLEEPER 2-like [Lactuca sativa]|uniref:zinc finger BED domain-containing protein RICESLEEPER 2-like n=1 Tax=Lactuca sativa TaxID=4236 RepID=UPI0022AFADE9|nr:zinc finger BED domain-containing protein RICESLEEPER 2-like [Lactuca sativa]
MGDTNNTNPLDVNDGSDDSVEEIGPESISQGVESTSTKQRKKRKKTSDVWRSFEMLPQKPNEPLYCKCKKCGAKYQAKSENGTGNLRRHRDSCDISNTRDIGQYMISSNNGVMATRNPKFSQETFREMVTHAMVRHDLPFSFVEYEGVRNFCKYLEPEASLVCRNTAKSDIQKLYTTQQKRLRDESLRCPSRICLTSDAWTSIVTDGYLSLTAHYVDSSWVLQKRILNFSHFPPPHTGVAIAEKLGELIKSWGIEKKLFSITLDNAASNDVCVELLKNQFRLMNSLVYDGKLFHLRCCAHILNLIVQDGLKQIDVAVEKVRDSVKYIKGSTLRKDRFIQICSQNLLDYKKALVQDVPTRWNSTYKMLSCALYYRLAFSHLSLSDSNFQTCPSSDEWDRVEKMCSFLKVFHDATLQFSGSLYPTSNLYFPQIFGIHLKLVETKDSPNEYMKKIATQMWSKFSKYWADINLLLAIAVVFDPRYKFSFVEFSYKKLYCEGSSQLKRVEEALFALFDEYMQASQESSVGNVGGGSGSGDFNSRQASVGNVGGGSNHSILEEFDEYDNDDMDSTKKRQLQVYLLEPRTKRTSSINILEFWQSQQYRYPELAKLAMDILCVPVSTVASESAFSLGGRVLNEYRSSMKPDIVEAIICSRDWLFGEKGSIYNLLFTYINY